MVCLRLWLKLMRLNIEIYGTGPVLVFFHGWGFDSTVWHSLVSYLDKNYSLYLVDLPGFGHSSNMEWALFKKKLLAYCPDKFSLVGWSLGGLYATRLALEEAHRVSCLINVASTPCFIKSANWPGVSATTLQKFAQQLALNFEATLVGFIRAQGVDGSCAFTFKSNREGLYQGLQYLEQWNFIEELARVKIPVAYFFGNLDSIVPWRTLPRLQEKFPHFFYQLFKPAAHLLFLNQPQQFCEKVRYFIEKVASN